MLHTFLDVSDLTAHRAHFTRKFNFRILTSTQKVKSEQEHIWAHS